ncbi:MAG: T9SS type A sorting domain-containing protein [Bacteroidota bacterium]
MNLLKTIVLIFISSQLFGQINFYKTYSGNGYDKGEGIVQLEDSSYMITGSSSSWSGNSDAFLLHLDSLGNYLWSRNYGGQESEGGRRVLYNADLGFYVAGYSNSYNSTGDFDAYLLKTDLNGNDLWHKTYGESDSLERINDAVMTLDSGIIMVGETVDMSNDNSDLYIVRTTKDGDTLWTKTIGGTEKDIANSIIKLNNNYLIGGQYFIPDSNMVKGFVLELNDQGDVLRFDTISDRTGNYVVTDLSLGVGKYYVIGYRENTSSFNDYYGVYNLDGSLISHYTSVAQGYSSIPNEIAFISATDRAAIGYQSINPGTNQDAFDLAIAYYTTQDLYYITQNWSSAITNDGVDKINDLIPTSDGAFVVVGFNSIMDDGIVQQNGGSNIFVAKIGPNNVFPSDVNSTLTNLVGLSESKENEQIKIYPNPFNEVLKIQNSANMPIEAALFNHIGIQVWSEKVNGITEINTSILPSGIYFLQIGSKIHKVIKQ